MLHLALAALWHDDIIKRYPALAARNREDIARETVLSSEPRRKLPSSPRPPSSSRCIMSTDRDRTLLVIGSGPGNGRALACIFAAKRYGRVALIARRGEQLRIEKAAIEAFLGGPSMVRVETYALDVVNDKALGLALEQAESALGRPECVVYNAARVLPSEMLTHDAEEFEYDFKITVTALHSVAARVLPGMVEMARSDPTAMPSLIVPSSMLHEEPVPQYFALGVVKGAQRALVKSLETVYVPQGVHIGLITIGGPVSPGHAVWNPPNIARRAWSWMEECRVKRTSEVRI